ncbi:hypothetical protein DRZ77_02030 [Candidatus Woesearchaeota archaeon]|nr:hypothetical protein [Candidatus Woesearchaeota archaeon]RLE40528.1 MAG: hypothetical protein DRZ77_02030 [Candidatus Woesearchaeota archaeon]
MKITIDTKEDSVEELQRVIELLSALIKSGQGDRMQTSEVSSSVGDAFGAIFGSSSSSSGSDGKQGDESEDKPTVQIVDW